MRKRIINREIRDLEQDSKNWLNLENIALAEITSEDASHPIESALNLNEGLGWMASEPGCQEIRLLFDKPLRVKHIRLVFHEDKQPRTHEFALRWSADCGRTYRQIVRQQYNFSPPDTIREIEDYTVDITGMTTLELIIIPDISGGSALASILQLRLI